MASFNLLSSSIYPSFSFEFTPKKRVKMIPFKVVTVPDKISAGETKYQYYPRICDRRRVKLHELSEQISRQCSFTSADVIGVLEAFISVVPGLLKENCSVELGDFGIFSLHAKAKGSPTAGEVSKRNITEVKMAFRPGIRVKKNLMDANFQKKPLP